MRKITFRAWDKRFNRMQFGAGDLLLRVNDTDHSQPMQYTGLKDKNGKEIYEGDIICVVEDALDGGQEGDFMEVVFDKFGCWSLDGGQIIKGELLYDQHKYAEVIGNIYENPDILKQ